MKPTANLLWPGSRAHSQGQSNVYRREICTSQPFHCNVPRSEGGGGALLQYCTIHDFLLKPIQTDWAELSNLRAQSQPTVVYPLTFTAVTMATGKCLSQWFIPNFLSILGVSCVQVVKAMDQKFRLESHLSLHRHRALLWETSLGLKGLRGKSLCLLSHTLHYWNSDIVSSCLEEHQSLLIQSSNRFWEVSECGRIGKICVFE